MTINTKKTGLVLVSAATSFDARVGINLNGQTICGSDNLKILGVTLHRDGSFKTHTAGLSRKMRAKPWALSRLKKKRLSETDLVKTYKCLIRPTAEYALPAWHSLLTAAQSAEIERQQSQSLKNIFGPGISAFKMRQKAGLETLFKRRETMAKKFALKPLANPRTTGWFQKRKRPKYSRRNSVNYPKYREETAHTDRHRNSLKNYLIRRLNE